ncbi:hypothetical protein B0O80DRAFT_504029 [Mortierella sp. GBAus27b]|nr:hypothetical protein B0O80DRAFT_504029 [Mortierella sp. GBAus27b]
MMPYRTSSLDFNNGSGSNNNINNVNETQATRAAATVESKEFEEVIKEYEAEEIIKIQENTIEGVKTEETKTVKKSSKVIVEQIVEVKKDIIVEKDVQVNETVTKVTTGTGTVTKEAVPKIGSVGDAVKGPASGVAFGTVIVGAGAGAVASGTLHKVDGVWTRTVQVLNTRKGGADEKCPVGKHTFVYYVGEVYDSEIAEVPTGVRHITQLIYNSQTHVYYGISRQLIFTQWTQETIIAFITSIRTVVNDVTESERLQDSRRRTMDMVSGLAQSSADALPLPIHDDIYYHHQRLSLLDENESSQEFHQSRQGSSDLETGSSIDTPVRKGMEPLTAFASWSKKND